MADDRTEAEVRPLVDAGRQDRAALEVPPAVTAVACLQMLGAVFGLIVALVSYGSQPWVALAALATCLIALLLGAALLHGANLARWLLVALWVSGVAAGRLHHVYAAIAVAALIYAVTNRQANAFFRRGGLLGRWQQEGVWLPRLRLESSIKRYPPPE